VSAAPPGIPFVDLKAQLPEVEAPIMERIRAVMQDSDFVLGHAVDVFETAFARYCGVGHAVGVDSGFSALELIFRALEIGDGDEVITQANTFVATVSAIIQAGARPVLVDCLADGRINPDAVERAITTRTRAIVPVHLYGRLPDMAALLEISTSRSVPLIEDACQAHGAIEDGRRAGSFGAAAAFSFYPGKNLGAYGDAGAVITSDSGLDDWIRRARHYGQKAKYEHLVTPLNRRIDTIQAAVLDVKLAHLDAWNQRRISLADAYREHLHDLPVTMPAGDNGGGHVYHLFAIELEDRDGLARHLAADGIQSGIHYPRTMHEVPAFGDLGYAADAFPQARRRARMQLSLPIYPELGLDGVARVAASVRAFFGHVPG
jgi:dTDP-4-amino-4,6-dideoxygalactose transaminase